MYFFFKKMLRQFQWCCHQKIGQWPYNCKFRTSDFCFIHNCIFSLSDCFLTVWYELWWSLTSQALVGSIYPLAVIRFRISIPSPVKIYHLFWYSVINEVWKLLAYCTVVLVAAVSFSSRFLSGMFRSSDSRCLDLDVAYVVYVRLGGL